jgi:hypothetical protein
MLLVGSIDVSCLIQFSPVNIIRYLYSLLYCFYLFVVCVFSVVEVPDSERCKGTIKTRFSTLRF